MTTLTPDTIAHLAAHLERAELEAFAVDKITDDHPGMDEDDAYAIQHEIRRRKIGRGARIVGYKAGLTSRAKMRQMGVETPSYGFLADYFAVPDGGEVAMAELIHPKVEPELAFVTKAPLRGPSCHMAQVLAATDFVLPAVEIIDSRDANRPYQAAAAGHLFRQPSEPNLRSKYPSAHAIAIVPTSTRPPNRSAARSISASPHSTLSS